MMHISDARWVELRADDLSPAEAEHLSACPLCEQRWSEQTTGPWLTSMQALADATPAAPATLHGIALANFEHAHAARAHTAAVAPRAPQINALANLEPARATSKQVLWIACASIHVLAGLAWLLMGGSTTFLIARLSVIVANCVTVLGVTGRLAAHFPLLALLHLASLALCALLLGWFWARTLRGVEIMAGPARTAR